MHKEKRNLGKTLLCHVVSLALKAYRLEMNLGHENIQGVIDQIVMLSLL